MNKSPQEVRNARNAELRSDMDEAVASGDLVIRQMTPAERKTSDAVKESRAADNTANKGKRRQKAYV
jgi:hypothetical protein